MAFYPLKAALPAKQGRDVHGPARLSKKSAEGQTFSYI